MSRNALALDLVEGELNDLDLDHAAADVGIQVLADLDLFDGNVTHSDTLADEGAVSTGGDPTDLLAVHGVQVAVFAGDTAANDGHTDALDSGSAESDHSVTADDENVMQMALVENIQREDLNAIEIALAYQNLIEKYDLTQDQLSEKVGKKRATIANYLRLLKLPAQVQVALQNRQVDQGHARALLGLNQPSMQVKLFGEIQENGYSVRQVEEMVKAINSGEVVKSGRKQLGGKSASRLPEEYNVLRERLSDFFRSKVQMTCTAGGKGKISIPFNSEEDLERIVALFDKMRR